MITGKVQEVYAALPIEESADYKIVKAAILKAYELVPEAYRQRFRHYSKLSVQTYVEFVREKEILFDRWCASQKAESKEQIRQLILVEELKKCLPAVLSTYISEQKADTLYKAATLADDFVLTHKVTFKEKSWDRAPAASPVSAFQKTTSSKPIVTTVDRVCFYCKVPGHLIATCPVLKKKSSQKFVGLISGHFCSDLADNVSDTVVHSDKSGYGPFLQNGTVSVPGLNEPVPVRMLRDTGASLSFLLEGILPFSDETATGSAALV